MTNANNNGIQKQLEGMAIGGNSIQVGAFVVVRINKSTWRLGEWAGDWLMRGTAQQVAERMGRRAA